jgi:hypothetical protein
MAGFFLLAVQRTPLAEGSEAAPLFLLKKTMKLPSRDNETIPVHN